MPNRVPGLLLAAMLAVVLGTVDSAFAQQDPPGCILNSLIVGVGRPPELAITKIDTEIPYSVTITVPNDIGLECTILLSEITFFSPANPPATGLICDSPNGLVLDTDVMMIPGTTMRFTGDPADPIGGIFNAGLIYTVDPADQIPNPNGEGQVILASACAQGIAFTGEVPGIAEGQNNIATTILNPAVEISKSGFPSVVCEGQGQDVKYTYTVTVPQDAGKVPPDGDVSLSDVEVTDDACGPVIFAGGDDGDGLLNPGETWQYTCTAFVDTETTNTATVTAVEPILDCAVADSASFTVTANETPVCDITAPVICDGTGGIAFVEDAGPGATYDWSINGGRIDDGDNTPQISYSHLAGQGLTIGVIVTNADGCSCEEETGVRVNPSPACSIDGPDPVCSGTKNLIYCGPPGLDYSWSIIGSGTIDGSSDLACVQVDAGPGANFTLTLMVTDNAGCMNVCSRTIDLDPSLCTGACCLEDGSCIGNVTQAVCEAQDGDYQGDFSVCNDVKCPQPEGACCLIDGSCITLIEEECDAVDGDFQGDFSSCKDTDCPQPPGACCLADGSCIEVVEEDCPGDFQGDMTLCADTDCPQPPGACCLADGSCIQVVEEDCGGDFQGDMTLCANTDCPQPPGACCLADGSCIEVVEEDCAGDFQGDMTLCADTDCPQPPGACCLADGSCIEVVEEDCAGDFQGDMTLCADTDCPQPPGACCLADGSCIEVVEEDCAGDFQGDMTLCADTDCPQPPGACCLPDGTCIEVIEENCPGDYQGDMTLCADTDCPQPPGACCLADGTCIEVIEENCPGDFQGDMTLCADTDCEQPPGACCLEDGSCIEVVEEACAGDFQGDMSSCLDVRCPQPPGACCLEDGTCIEVTQEMCKINNGDFQGDLVLCESVKCPQPEGACCFDDGSCLILTEDECNLLAGDYQGDDTPCVPNDCPQPPGACCFIDGSCAELLEEDCMAMNGDFQGDLVTCEAADCPPPTGACCLMNGDCLVVDEMSCDEMGGEYQGDFTGCVPSPCPDRTGACCIKTDCQVLTEEDCLAMDGEYEGDDTDCVDNPCLGGCGTPNAGNCFNDNGNNNPFCKDEECCELICKLDPFCCEDTWDRSCVDQALLFCGNCGQPDAGDCFESNGSPGCDDQPCCKATCQVDAYCCHVQWDAVCADQASYLCDNDGKGKGGGKGGERTCPAPGSCFELHLNPGCDNEDCCTTVCDFSPVCCQVSWDADCVGIALYLCGE